MRVVRKERGPLLEVWPEQPQTSGGLLQIEARFQFAGSKAESLWYRVPEIHRTSITTSGDPFAIGLLFQAMRRGAQMRVYGRVSRSLLLNLREVSAAWRSWTPERYSAVEIEADTEAEDETAVGDATLMTFSGGLDSCLSAWRHTQESCGKPRRNLKAALMVHGFDIPIAEDETFSRAADNSRKIVESIGLEFIPVATNYRQFKDEWEDAHGAALASCLHLFRRRFSTGLIAGSHSFTTLRFPWGSNPITDALFSTKSFNIAYDGLGYSRREKAREVADWPEAMQRMRVCWEGASKDRNCGKCVRCVGTALCFAVERKPIPSSLPIDSLPDAIRGLEIGRLKPAAAARMRELLTYARASEIDEPWVDTLDQCLGGKGAPSRGHTPRFRKKLAKIWKKLT